MLDTARPEVHVVSVGSKIMEPRTPGVAAVYRRAFTGAPLEFFLFYDRPTPAEVQAVKKGDIQYRVRAVRCGSTTVVAFGIQVDGLWQIMPWTIRLVPDEWRPERPEPGHLAAHIMLVDAHTGVLRALRFKTVAPALVASVWTIIDEQAGQAFDLAAYNRICDHLYNQYPGRFFASSEPYEVQP